MVKKKILIILSVLCIIGGIIGLVIYLTRRKKNGGKTPSPSHGYYCPSGTSSQACDSVMEDFCG